MSKKEQKFLSQCPDCKIVKILYEDGVVREQYSIVVFDKLPKEHCYKCTEKHQQEPIPVGEIPM
jgi:hypothetical protein